MDFRSETTTVSCLRVHVLHIAKVASTNADGQFSVPAEGYFHKALEFHRESLYSESGQHSKANAYLSVSFGRR